MPTPRLQPRALHFGAVLAILLTAAPARAGSPPVSSPPPVVPAAERVRGVCWEGGRPVVAADLAPVTALGAGWISQTPFGWQRAVDEPRIRVNSRSVLGFGPYWGETDTGLAVTARLAHRAGLKVMLKPHVWLHGGRWCGEIRMRDARGWQAWFREYTAFITHYAALAERERMEMLCVGVELKGTASRERDWRAVIAAVRRVYHGRLTYAANWDGEVDSVAFWDALDAIGVQAYYPLSEFPSPAGAELERGWERWREPLEGAARAWGRPVLFTEVGYKSCRSAATRPWEWDPDGPADMGLQERCYEALFRVFWDRPWFAGVCLWKWHPKHDDAGGPADRTFTPQHKPAERVAKMWFSRPMISP
ncbi:MAG: hypothetical protein HZB25_13050 [Candidatus Eisenbacteria bacterium]|nr:hypothetical protein [Candidatus Eisenbacteria bacterium]